MEVYQAEIEAGLSAVLSDPARASVCYDADICEANDLDITTALTRAEIAKKSVQHLHPMHSILASVGWNRNDDVFTPEEVWAARKSPEDKPFNYQHDEKDIIGHIVGQYALDADLNLIDDEIAAEDLPEKFHLAIASVLYKKWDDEDLQERMEGILEEIAKGKWFVSMECHFTNFAYALDGPTGKHIVPRNKETAFLTKYLRAYGGKGVYEGHKVGRVLGNLSFSAVGLVKKPANPESVIFANGVSDFRAKANEAILREIKMADTEKLEQAVAALQAEKAALEKTIAETNIKGYTDRISALEGDVAKANESQASVAQKLSETEAALAKANSDLEAVKAELATATEAANAAKAELDAIKQTEVKRARVERLVKSGLDEAKAAETADKFAGLNDELFEAMASMIVVPAVAPVEPKEEKVEAAAAAVANAEPEKVIATQADPTPIVEKTVASELAEYVGGVLSEGRKNRTQKKNK